jgi:hypothetical protein
MESRLDLATRFDYASGVPKTAPPEEAEVCLFLHFPQPSLSESYGGLIFAF